MYSIIKEKHGVGNLAYRNFQNGDDLKNLKRGEALVKVEYASICGSDIHAYNDVSDYSSFPVPRILGHEASGVVKSIYSWESHSNSPVSVGDNVAINPIIECGYCNMCKMGYTNVCYNRKILGSQLNGVFTEEVKVPIDHLIKIKNDIDSSISAMTEPLAVAVHSAKKAFYYLKNSDQKIVIFGAGKISFFISLVLRNVMKISDVEVIGLKKDIEHRFPLFNQHKIETFTFEEKMDNSLRPISNDLEARPFVVIEASGSNDGLIGSLNLVQHRGKVISVGLFDSDPYFCASDLVRTEKEIIGSDAYLKEDLEDAAKYIENGMISKKFLRVYEPSDYENAFLDYERSEVMAALFDFKSGF